MGGSQKLQGCGKIIKLCFLLLNFLYLVVGVGLIAAGAYLIATNDNFSLFIGNPFFSGAALIIICGIVVFFITIFGMVGALFQKKWILSIYVFVVAIIIILELAAGILGYVYRDDITNSVSDGVVEAIDNYYNDSTHRDAVDNMQKRYKCCGWYTTSVWETLPGYNASVGYPESCKCDEPEDMEENENCMPSPVPNGPMSIYSRTCNGTATDAFKLSVAAIGGVGIGFAIIQIVPFLLGFFLIYLIHKSSEYTTV